MENLGNPGGVSRWGPTTEQDVNKADQDDGALPDGIVDSEHSYHSIIHNIFNSCDVGTPNSVPVSKLIEYISPFMQNDVTALVQLQKALDPKDNDICVDRDTFSKEMALWVSRIRITNPPPLDNLEEKIIDYGMGEPCSKNSKTLANSSFFKDHLDVDVQNLSNISSLSYYDISNPMDSIYVQEQIKELDYQNRKLTIEVEDVRLLLAHADDQIYNLQKELSDASKKLILEQQCNEDLQKNIKLNDELAHAYAIAQNQIAELQKILATSNKEMNHLEQRIEALEKDKRLLEHETDQHHQYENATKTFIMELQSELNVKNQVIASLEDTTANLESQLTDKQQMLTHFTDVNEQLKLEKLKLEENFRKALTHHTLSNHTRSRTSSSLTDPIDSGIPKHIRRLSSDNFKIDNPSFNSPTLLHMLKNPVSPNVSFVVRNKIFEDNFPNRINNNNTSTPNKQHTVLDNNIRQSSKEKQLFAQYRFLDNGVEHFSSSRSMDNSQTDIIQPKLNLDNTSDIDIYHSCDVKNTSSYVADSGCILNAARSSNTSNFEASSEDETFWKLHMVQHSPRPSLESEMLQANIERTDTFDDVALIHKQYQEKLNKLQKKSTEYQTTIQQLVNEVHSLKQQNVEKFHSEESDNQKQYLKIVELMEKTDILNTSLEKCSVIREDEVRNYKANISEIEAERDKLLDIIKGKRLHELLQISFLDSNINLDLQVQFEQSLETINEVSKKNSLLVEENLGLKKEVSSLTAVLHEINTNSIVCGNLVVEKDVVNYMYMEQVKLQQCDFPESDNIEYSSDLNNPGNSYKTRIGALSNEIFKLTNVNAEMSQTLNERNIQIGTLKEMVQLQNAQIALLQTEKSNVFETLQEVKLEKNNCMDEIEMLKKELGKLEVECETLKTANNLSMGQLENLNKEYVMKMEYGVGLSADYSVMLNLKQGLQKRNDTLVSDVNAYKLKIQKLQDKLERVKEGKHKEVAALNNQIVNLENLNTQLNMQFDTLSNKIVTLEDLNSKLGRELDIILKNTVISNGESKETSCVHCTKLESDKNDLHSTIEALQFEINKNKSRNFNRMSLRNDKLKQRIDDLEISNAILQKKIDENLKVYTYETDCIVNEKKSLEMKISELEDVQQHLNDAEVENEILNKKNSALEEKIQSLHKEKQKLMDVEDKLILLTKDLKRIKNEKMGLQEELKRDKVKIKDLEHTLNNTELSVKHCMREKTTVLKEKKDVETKLQKIHEDFQKLDNQNKELLIVNNQISTYNTYLKKKEQKTSTLEKEIQRLQQDKLELEELILVLKGDLQSLENKIVDLEKQQADITFLQSELLETNVRLTQCTIRSSELTEHFNFAKKLLKLKRKDLAKTTLTLANSWDSVLINDYITIEELVKEVPLNAELCHLPLDEELKKLELQINLTTSLLERLVNQANGDLSKNKTSSTKIMKRALDRSLSVSQVPWLRTFLILVIVVIFIICCILMEMYNGNNIYSMFNYPWEWTSWEEILSPFIKRNYPNGPPPI